MTGLSAGGIGYNDTADSVPIMYKKVRARALQSFRPLFVLDDVQDGKRSPSSAAHLDTPPSKNDWKSYTMVLQ